GGLRDGERDAEDRVRAELALVGGAVEVDEGGVDEALVLGLEADELRGDVVDHGVDRALDSLAQVAGLVAVTALDGLERTGRRARRHGGAGERPVVQDDLDLDGRVSAGVEDLARSNGFDAGHRCSFGAGLRALRQWGAADPGRETRDAACAPATMVGLRPQPSARV